VNIVDKLESKIHCAVVGDYSKFNMPAKKIISKEFDLLKSFVRDFKSEPLLRAVIEPILGLYSQAVDVYRGWDNLKEGLTPYLGIKKLNPMTDKELKEFSKSLIEKLVYFRQFEPKGKDLVAGYLQQSIEKLRWMAPDEQTVYEALTSLTASEQMVLEKKRQGIDSSVYKAAMKHWENKKKEEAKLMYGVISRIVSLFEQLHLLFPGVSEKDFEETIYNAILRDTINSLVEKHPMYSKPAKGKKSSEPKLENDVKVIIKNLRNGGFLAAFSDALESLMEDYDSDNGRRMLEVFKSEVGLNKASR
jgi:hypothetical protein